MRRSASGCPRRRRPDQFALHAWVRQGEIEGRAVPTEPYDEARFREALSGVRALTTTPRLAERTNARSAAHPAGVGTLVARAEFPKTSCAEVSRAWLSTGQGAHPDRISATAGRTSSGSRSSHVGMPRHSSHPQKEIIRRREQRDGCGTSLGAADQALPRTPFDSEQWAGSSAATMDPSSAGHWSGRSPPAGVDPGIVRGARLQHEKSVPYNATQRLSWSAALHVSPGTFMS